MLLKTVKKVALYVAHFILGDVFNRELQIKSGCGTHVASI